MTYRAGATGQSAYQIAVANGFVGTEAAWLASLEGNDGTNGTNGTNGVGVPTGGATGQLLAKSSATDYATLWIDPPAGGTGSTWRTGSGAPSNSLGVDGDLYLNTANADVYKRASGTYSIVANIKGTPGTNGTNGTNGAAATIAVGTVTTGAAGSSASVTNVGTSSAAVFDFNIPRGATGASGGGAAGLPEGWARFEDFDNVDATGATDSRPGLLAAHDSGAKVVLAGNGTFRIDGQFDWTSETGLEGLGVDETVFDIRTTTHGLRLRPADFGARVRWRNFTIDGANSSQGSTNTYAGLLQQRKIFAENICVKRFRHANVRTAPYDANADGTGGTIGQAAFFSTWTNCRFSESETGDGFDLRMGFNCTGFINCQFDKNGTGSTQRNGLHIRTDGGATYGVWVLGGQASYNTGPGLNIEAGTDLRVYAFYTEYNGTPTNSNSDGYTNTQFDVYVGDNCPRSSIDVGVLLNANAARVRAPAKGLNDSCIVWAGGQRFFGSTRYMMNGVRVASPADATGTAVSVAKFNELLAALKSGGHLS